MKKQTLYIIFGAVIITLACTIGTGAPAAPTQAQGDQVSTIVAETMQALTAQAPTAVPSEAAPTQASGTSLSCGTISFVLPNGLAGGVTAEAVPAVTEANGATWDVAPAHTKCTLTGYQLQGKFHEPQIFVYPADEYARVSSIGAEEIDRVKKIVGGFTPMKETLPFVPFFNATALIAARIQLLPFQNGQGVRSLTQYAQYTGPINNHELFYHFQGLTADNKYYLIVVLPVTAPILAEGDKPSSPVPADGVPFPAENMGPNSPYYVQVTEKLNALPPDSYAPSLNTLDALIQSLLVTTP